MTRFIRLLLWIPAVVVGCADNESRNPWPPATDITTLDAAVVWSRHIELQEADSVINVMPSVRVDPAGGFLIADARESQFRRYDVDGALIQAFGRNGDGPGEVRRPTALVRGPSGDLLGFDLRLRLVIFDSTGAGVKRTVQTPFSRADAAYLWDDSTVLVAGQLTEGPSQSLLHLWDPEGDSVRLSFFDPVPKDASVLARSYGWASVARLGDGMVATYSPSDTLYVLDRRGTVTSRIPIPIRGFRHIAPPPTRMATPEWRASFDFVTAVHAVGDDLLVEWIISTADGPQRNLILMTLEGTPRFSLRDTPRLLMVTDEGELVFVEPGSLTPNRWAIGRLRY